MKAVNISSGPFYLESGEVAPSDSGEFTEAEFKFLSGMGRAEEYVEPPKKPAPKRKPAAKKVEQDEPKGFL